jgi:endo-1,4-beta-mannosidase
LPAYYFYREVIIITGDEENMISPHIEIQDISDPDNSLCINWDRSYDNKIFFKFSINFWNKAGSCYDSKSVSVHPEQAKKIREYLDAFLAGM